MKNKILILLYLIAGLTFCFAIYSNNDLLRTISKPIPLFLLLILVKPNTKYKALIFAGFIFSLAGDIFLLKVIDLFIFGLASFLIAHAFYVFAFMLKVKKLKILTSIPFYITGTALAYYFYPFLGEMMIPVFIYIFVIITMVWRAYLQRNYHKFAMYAFIGAVLFAISDSNIALTKFVHDYDYSQIITIVLYWSSQFLIYKSTTKA